jgi:predicted NACHT family NTPase
MIADSAWDSKKLYTALSRENLALLAATNVRRNKNKVKFTPLGRWKIEQIFGIQQWSRGIKFCWTKTKDSFLALVQLASAIHNFRLVGVFV